jgi:hypothetical protein
MHFGGREEHLSASNLPKGKKATKAIKPSKAPFMAWGSRDQFFDRVRYPPQPIKPARQAIPHPFVMFSSGNSWYSTDTRPQRYVGSHLPFLALILPSSMGFSAWALARAISGQHFVGGDNALHLLGISATVWMIALRQFTVAALDLIGGRIQWETQDC